MSDLRAAVSRLRNSLTDSVANHRLKTGETEHARGWYNAYEELAIKLLAILDDHPKTHENDALINFMKPELDKVLNEIEKKAMRSAVAWYISYLERERDNRG